MPIEGEYEPSTWDWVREQVELYEGSNGEQGNTLRDTGIPIIVMTTVGHKSGKVRKVPLMRVEHDGAYAIVASKGGAPAHPGWYHNLMADPKVTIQDGPAPFDAVVRLADGAERAAWWDRSVAVFPNYAEYQAKTDREIPLFIAEASGAS
ncbi:MAG: nitroreductase family deazaflavin-dependent oxidoreductase [Actinomycetota bacterium]